MPYRQTDASSLPVSSRQFLQLVERVAAIGTWSWEPTTGRMVWSAALHRLLGTDPASHQPSMDDIVARTHPDDRWIMKEKIRPSGSMDDQPARMVMPDGSIRWLVCYKEDVFGKEGETSLVIGILQDVTTAWTGHRVLLQRQRLLDTLLRLVGGMLWRTEPDGSLSFDSGWSEFTGTTLAQNAGRGWLSALHPDDRAAVGDAWRRAIETRQFYAARFRVRRYDGVYVLVESKASPLFDAYGGVVEWVGYCSPARAAVPPDEAPPDGTGPSPREVRAARALIGIGVKELSEASGVSTATITRYESAARADGVRPGNLDKLRTAFAAWGVTFVVQLDGARALSYRPKDLGPG